MRIYFIIFSCLLISACPTVKNESRAVYDNSEKKLPAVNILISNKGIRDDYSGCYWPWCAEKQKELKKNYLIDNIKKELLESNRFSKINFYEYDHYNPKAFDYDAFHKDEKYYALRIDVSAIGGSGRGYVETAGTNLTLGLVEIPVDVEFNVKANMFKNGKIVDKYSNKFEKTQHLSAYSDLQEYKKDAAIKIVRDYLGHLQNTKL